MLTSRPGVVPTPARPESLRGAGRAGVGAVSTHVLRFGRTPGVGQCAQTRWTFQMAPLIGVVSRALLVAIWTFGLVWMGGAMANTADCHAITDRDARGYCLAVVSRDFGYCYAVRAQDRRKLCLATLKGQRSYCYAIKERDTRKQCLAAVK